MPRRCWKTTVGRPRIERLDERTTADDPGDDGDVRIETGRPGWSSERAVFGGRVYIADTSAPARAGDPVVRDEWSAVPRSRQIATYSITTLELLYAARDAREVHDLEGDEAALRMSRPPSPSNGRRSQRFAR